MRAILLVLALAAVAVLGSRKVLGRSPLLGLRLISRTGILFLLLGVVSGPRGLNLFDEQVLNQLGLVIVGGLGWVGFLYGSHLELRILRKFPWRLYAVVITESGVTILVVAMLFVPLLAWLGLDVFSFEVLAPVALLGAAAAGTAPASLFLLRRERPIQGPNYETLRFCAALDDVPGLVLIGLLFSLLCSRTPGLSTGLWMFVAVALGLCFGFLFKALADLEPDAAAGGVVLLGVVALLSGISAYLQLSPLFVGMVTGATFANISPHRQRVYYWMARQEHTLYVIFLLLSGCLWEFDRVFSGTLLVVYLMARFLGKVVGAFLGRRFLPAGVVSPFLGIGLGPQGGIAVAMVVNYVWSFGQLAAPWAVGVVLTSVILNEVIAPWATVAFLSWCGET